MAFVTDSNRSKPRWQPPPTACLTASGAGSKAPSLPMHPRRQTPPSCCCGAAQVFAIYPFVLEACVHDMAEVAELPTNIQEKIYDHIKISFLDKFPLLQTASPQCRAEISTHMLRVVAPPGQYLTHCGEEGEAMFLLVKGVVEVMVKGDDGKERLQDTMREGSWFGHIALVHDGRHTESVRAVTPCSLFRLDKDGFQEVFLWGAGLPRGEGGGAEGGAGPECGWCPPPPHPLAPQPPGLVYPWAQ